MLYHSSVYPIFLETLFLSNIPVRNEIFVFFHFPKTQSQFMLNFTFHNALSNVF